MNRESGPAKMKTMDGGNEDELEEDVYSYKEAAFWGANIQIA